MDGYMCTSALEQCFVVKFSSYPRRTLLHFFFFLTFCSVIPRYCRTTPNSFMNGGRPTAGAPQNRPLTAKAAETPSPPPRNTNTPDSAPAHATGLGQDANIEASAAAMVAATGEANTVERDRISSDTATATKAGPTHLVVLGERRASKQGFECSILWCEVVQ